jgi:hypothetical protein
MFPGIRKWLPVDYPWRKRGDLFNGSEELETAPPRWIGEDINDLLEEWEACPTLGKKRPRVKPLLGVWKARSVFWDLSYWKYLLSSPEKFVMTFPINRTYMGSAKVCQNRN